MSVEKTPLDTQELTKLEGVAGKTEDGEIVILLRYTGMHVSVICDSSRNLREENVQGTPVIMWDRPKKKGKAAFTSIKKSKNIGFDINDFVESFQKRRRKCSRQYIHALVQRIGEDAGLPNISPMTLRHSACIDLLNRGVPEVTVRQIMNVSVKTMEHYAKQTDKGKVSILERVGW
jgi:integrase